MDLSSWCWFLWMLLVSDPCCESLLPGCHSYNEVSQHCWANVLLVFLYSCTFYFTFTFSSVYSVMSVSLHGWGSYSHTVHIHQMDTYFTLQTFCALIIKSSYKGNTISQDERQTQLRTREGQLMSLTSWPHWVWNYSTEDVLKQS